MPGQAPDTAVFGAELRRRRIAAGLTLSALATRLHYSKGYLSKIESGIKPAGPDLARRCDTALGAGGELAALYQGHAQPARRDVLIAGAATIFASQIPEISKISPMNAAAVAGAGSTAAGFADLLVDLRAMGQNRPPGMVLPTLIIQAHTLSALADNAPAAARDRLLLVYSRYAEYIGWMYQENDDEPAMSAWTDAAVAAATQAGDQELAAYAFVRRANVAMYRGQGAATVELARRAAALMPQDTPGALRVRTLAHEREAQGHALLLRRSDSLRAIDQAQAAAVRGRTEGMQLGPSTVGSSADLVSGWALYDLGQAEEAVPVLQRHLGKVPAPARRARARVSARLALAHTAVGDVDAACRVTEETLADARFVDSATLRHDLKRLSSSLARFRSRPEVQDLLPRLTQEWRPAV